MKSELQEIYKKRFCPAFDQIAEQTAPADKVLAIYHNAQLSISRMDDLAITHKERQAVKNMRKYLYSDMCRYVHDIDPFNKRRG